MNRFHCIQTADNTASLVVVYECGKEGEIFCMKI